jgi:hypothetical protein
MITSSRSSEAGFFFALRVVCVVLFFVLLLVGISASPVEQLRVLCVLMKVAKDAKLLHEPSETSLHTVVGAADWPPYSRRLHLY